MGCRYLLKFLHMGMWLDRESGRMWLWESLRKSAIREEMRCLVLDPIDR